MGLKAKVNDINKDYFNPFTMTLLLHRVKKVAVHIMKINKIQTQITKQITIFNTRKEGWVFAGWNLVILYCLFFVPWGLVIIWNLFLGYWKLPLSAAISSRRSAADSKSRILTAAFI